MLTAEVLRILLPCFAVSFLITLAITFIKELFF